MDPRGQHQPARVHEDVALASGETLGPVVAALRASHRGSLHHLAIDHRRARIWLAPFPFANRLAKMVVGSAQPAVYPPLAEVVVDGLPRRVLFRQHPPRTSAP